MRLFLLRHGIAEPARPGLADFDRVLTPEGRAELARIARGLRRLKIAPDAILSSPLARAHQTAEIVALALDREVETVEELASGAVLEDFLEILNRWSASGSLLLVGHEPDFSTAGALLVGAPEGALVLKKAGLMRVDIDGAAQAGAGRLRWLLTPSHLALFGDIKSGSDRRQGPSSTKGKS
jgi:phosphohistidine phosphatase